MFDKIHHIAVDAADVRESMAELESRGNRGWDDESSLGFAWTIDTLDPVTRWSRCSWSKRPADRGPAAAGLGTAWIDDPMSWTENPFQSLRSQRQMK